MFPTITTTKGKKIASLIVWSKIYMGLVWDRINMEERGAYLIKEICMS